MVRGSHREGLGESVLTNIIEGLDVYRHCQVPNYEGPPEDSWGSTHTKAPQRSAGTQKADSFKSGMPGWASGRGCAECDGPIPDKLSERMLGLVDLRDT